MAENGNVGNVLDLTHPHFSAWFAKTLLFFKI